MMLQHFGVRGQVRAFESGDASPQSKSAADMNFIGAESGFPQ